MKQEPKTEGGGRILLVVEDEPALREMLVETLQSPNLTILQAGSLAEARRALGQSSPSVMLLDIKLPDGMGLDLLPEFLGKDPCNVAIALTAMTDEATIVKAAQLGIMQFLTKPFASKNLLEAVDRAFDKSRESRKTLSSTGTKDTGQRDLIIGRDPRMMALKVTVGKLSKHATSVLIAGEYGTEKTSIARALHAYGSMSKEPFEVLDCKTLTPAQMESRLFVHANNGGSGTDKADGVELKARGTVLLDNVEYLPAGIQCKLVQVFRGSAAAAAGSSARPKPAFRILAATSSKLEHISAQKLICEELLSHLSSSVILVPPLRERLCDVPLLVEAFLADLSRDRKTAIQASAAALEIMRAYSWPGNVGELERVLLHCSLMGNNVIGAEDLPEHLKMPQREETGLTVAVDREENVVPLEEVERRYAAQVLKFCRGVKIKASKLLGIDRHTLESLMRPPAWKRGAGKPRRQGRRK